MSSEAKREEPTEVWVVLNYNGAIASAWAERSDAERSALARTKAIGITCTYCRYVIPEPSTPAAKAGDGWIRCSERMPERHEFVLAAAPGRGVEFAYLGNGDHGELVWYWAHHGYGLLSEVTHWQPLPAPPSPETNGG